MQELLQNVHPGLVDPEAACREFDRLICCSDGSSDDGKGLFGWSLRTPKGKEILHCLGQADGLEPSFFRAECFVILDALSIWLNFKLEGRLTNDHHLFFFCDNKGAVLRTKELLQKRKRFI